MSQEKDLKQLALALNKAFSARKLAAVSFSKKT